MPYAPTKMEATGIQYNTIINITRGSSDRFNKHNSDELGSIRPGDIFTRSSAAVFHLNAVCMGRHSYRSSANHMNNFKYSKIRCFHGGVELYYGLLCYGIA
jgi:hypothetical protein